MNKARRFHGGGDSKMFPSIQSRIKSIDIDMKKFIEDNKSNTVDNNSIYLVGILINELDTLTKYVKHVTDMFDTWSIVSGTKIPLITTGSFAVAVSAYIIFLTKIGTLCASASIISYFEKVLTMLKNENSVCREQMNNIVKHFEQVKVIFTEVVKCFKYKQEILKNYSNDLSILATNILKEKEILNEQRETVKMNSEIHKYCDDIVKFYRDLEKIDIACIFDFDGFNIDFSTDYSITVINKQMKFKTISSNQSIPDGYKIASSQNYIPASFSYETKSKKYAI
jgi:hypothetical protein